jgi:aspartyl protease family protein
MANSQQSKFWLWWFIGSITLGVLIYWLATLFPDALESDGAQIGLVHSILVLVLVSSSLAAHRRVHPGHILRNIAIWVIIATFLFVGYSYRYELASIKNRVIGELLPHRADIEGGEARFRANENGHFVVEAHINGNPIRFLVDTGASDVTLSPADARRLGINLETLNFNRRYATANGVVFGAPIRLDKIEIGPIAVRNVRASVNGADMRRSLLGMSFLERLDGFNISKNILTLRTNN